MKVIARFFWDCGRSGDIDGIFVAEKSEIHAALGKHLYFGEVLGKHSEVYGTLEEKDIQYLSEDQDFIEKFEKIVGANPSGFNPLEYLPEDE